MITPIFFVMMSALQCDADPDGFCSKEIIKYDIGESENDIRINLNTVIGDAFLIHFESPLAVDGLPALGNKAAFLMEPQGSRGDVIAIWPQHPAGSQEDIAGIASNLHIKLKSGENIIITMRILNADSGVQKLSFSSKKAIKDKSFLEEQFKKKESDLESAYQRKIEELRNNASLIASKVIAQKVMVFANCAPVNKHDTGLTRLTVKKVCLFDDLLVITFDISNRQKNTIVSIKNVRITPMNESSSISDVSLVGPDTLIDANSTETHIGFGEEARRSAVAYIAGTRSRNFRLDVELEGGVTLFVAGISP